MWLPEDGRNLILGYYMRIGEVERMEWFDMRSWPPLLATRRVKMGAKHVPAYGDEA